MYSVTPRKLNVNSLEHWNRSIPLKLCRGERMVWTVGSYAKFILVSMLLDFMISRAEKEFRSQKHRQGRIP